MSPVADTLMLDNATQAWNAEDCIRDMSASPGSDQLAVADAKGAVSVLDIATGKLKWSKLAHNLGASLIDWRGDASMIASAGQDGYIKLWQPESGEVVKVFQIDGMWVEQLKWSPDSRYLAASAGKSLLVWDDLGKDVINYSQHQSTVTSIAWKRNSKEIASACYKEVRLFKVGYNRPYQSLKCLGSLISLAWRPDGKAICAGSQDRRLQYWRLSSKGSAHAEMKGYREKVNVLDWSRDGQYLASAGSRDLVVWNTVGSSPAGTAPGVLKGHAGRVSAACFQNHGELLASAASDGSVIIWDLKKASGPYLQWELQSPITRLAWTGDDKCLVVGTQTGQLRFFKLGQDGVNNDPTNKPVMADNVLADRIYS